MLWLGAKDEKTFVVVYNSGCYSCRNIGFRGNKRAYHLYSAGRSAEDVFKYYEEVGDLGREEYEQTVETVRSLSVPKLPDAPKYPEQLMFLSTCSYHTDDGRFVVAAYRIK